MQWITRSYVHLDRVASPWLILRFIDREAQFLFVPWGEEARAAEHPQAIPFALPGAECGPHDEHGSTFHKLLQGYALHDAALMQLDRVISAGVANVLHHYQPPAEDREGQIAVGLLAIAEGMLLRHRDDAEIIRHSLGFYDALYAQFRAEQLLAAQQLHLPGHADGRGPTSNIDFLRSLLDADARQNAG